MVGCVLSQLKSSELYILSCEKGGFSQLRMQTSSQSGVFTSKNADLLAVGLYPIPKCHITRRRR